MTTKTHGGKRPRSGRKETGINQTPISFKIDNELITPLSEFCKANDLKKNKAFNLAIRQFLGT